MFGPIEGETVIVAIIAIIFKWLPRNPKYCLLNGGLRREYPGRNPGQGVIEANTFDDNALRKNHGGANENG
jgi:hypothetical protein